MAGIGFRRHPGVFGALARKQEHRVRPLHGRSAGRIRQPGDGGRHVFGRHGVPVREMAAMGLERQGHVVDRNVVRSAQVRRELCLRRLEVRRGAGGDG